MVDKNYVGALQELCQSQYWSQPNYGEFVNKGASDHLPDFWVNVTLDGFETCFGHGTTKKIAKQEAARNLLEAIKSGPASTSSSTLQKRPPKPVFSPFTSQVPTNVLSANVYRNSSSRLSKDLPAHSTSSLSEGHLETSAHNSAVGLHDDVSLPCRARQPSDLTGNGNGAKFVESTPSEGDKSVYNNFVPDLGEILGIPFDGVINSSLQALLKHLLNVAGHSEPAAALSAPEATEALSATLSAYANCESSSKVRQDSLDSSNASPSQNPRLSSSEMSTLGSREDAASSFSARESLSDYVDRDIGADLSELTIRESEDTASHNFVGELQEICQSQVWRLPVYGKFVNKSSMQHLPNFCVNVAVENYGTCAGSGTTKKSAKQDAARNMLERIRHRTLSTSASSIKTSHVKSEPSLVSSPVDGNALSPRPPTSECQRLSSHRLKWLLPDAVPSSKPPSVSPDMPKAARSRDDVAGFLDGKQRATDLLNHQDSTDLSSASLNAGRDLSCRNFVGELQELCQSLSWSPPIYSGYTNRSSLQHLPDFRVNVTVDGCGTCYGRGTTKKNAKQDAARKILEIIEEKYREFAHRQHSGDN